VGLSLQRGIGGKMETLTIESLLPLARSVASALVERKATVAVAESSTGGLISAALLAVPGASAYFLGGAVIYTQTARRVLLGITDAQMVGMRASTETYALLIARRAQECHGAVWGIGETGATGPSGNRYGDAAGHVCIAVAGARKHVVTIETASDQRQENMYRFAGEALRLLQTALSQS
jgi:nicotinamide-nucleotide amidase